MRVLLFASFAVLASCDMVEQEQPIVDPDGIAVLSLDDPTADSDAAADVEPDEIAVAPIDSPLTVSLEMSLGVGAEL
jgi:hypothetical protein